MSCGRTTMRSPSSATGTRRMRPTARMAEPGGLMMAVKSRMPYEPRLVIVKVAPVYSSGLRRFTRARAMSSLNSRSMAITPLAPQSRTTGVMRPSSWATARPMSARA